MDNSSEGFYSIERIFELNFMQKKVLSLDLYNPIMFRGKEVFQLCVLKIDEPEERMELLLKRILQKEGNTDGLLRVKAYIDNPLEYESIVIDNRNILKIEHLM